MPPIQLSAEGHATKIPATAGWLLLAFLLTSMLLLGHWVGPLPATPSSAVATSSAAPRPAPAARPLALQTTVRAYSLPKPVLTATTRF